MILLLWAFLKTESSDFVIKSTNNMRFQTGGNTERMRINSSGNVLIPNDSGKLQLGASQDLQIYHDGSHSFIEDAGTGKLN